MQGKTGGSKHLDWWFRVYDAKVLPKVLPKRVIGDGVLVQVIIVGFVESARSFLRA